MDHFRAASSEEGKKIPKLGSGSSKQAASTARGGPRVKTIAPAACSVHRNLHIDPGRCRVAGAVSPEHSGVQYLDWCGGRHGADGAVFVFPFGRCFRHCEMVIDFRPERRRVRQIRLTPSQYFLVVLISAKCPSSPWQQRALARPGSDSVDAPSLKRDTLRASRLCRGQLMRSRVSKSATKSARKANTKETGRTSN